MTRYPRLFILLVTLTLSGNIFAETAVIVNKDNSLSSLSQKELMNIYRGKTELWNSGGKISPYNMKESSTRSEFYENMLDWRLEAMKSYWIRKIFTGKGTPPPEASSDSDMIDKVASEPGAIGYINASAVNNKVKRIVIN